VRELVEWLKCEALSSKLQYHQINKKQCENHISYARNLGPPRPNLAERFRFLALYAIRQQQQQKR
jgi:hypothetical protein